MSISKAGLATVAWTVVSLPVQRMVSSVWLGSMGRAVGAKATYDTLGSVLGRFGLPMISFETMTLLLLLLNQANVVFEMFLGKQLRRFRENAYSATVASRGKAPEFWTPYTEEYRHPRGGATGRPARTMVDRLMAGVTTRLLRNMVRRVVNVLFGAVPCM